MSGVAIFMVLWFLALIPTLDPRALLRKSCRQVPPGGDGQHAG
jgi:hypothetical protein